MHFNLLVSRSAHADDTAKKRKNAAWNMAHRVKDKAIRVKYPTHKAGSGKHLSRWWR